MSFDFLEYLHQEKLKHKEHRQKHLVQKLIISGLLFSAGPLFAQPEFAFFIFLCVPILCIVQDVYIFSEHYKVARIGHFLRHDASVAAAAPGPLTACMQAWEIYVEAKREKCAVYASYLYTLVIGLLCAFIAHHIFSSHLTVSSILAGWGRPLFLVWSTVLIVSILFILVIFKIKMSELAR